jgi:prepilin-type N-terminal cleavage/methylation domain-containing protein
MTKSTGSAREAGFTLIEVLVAFVILSVALMGLYDTLGVSYRSANATRVQEEAVAVGRSQLDRIGRDIPITVGALTGQLSDGSTWRIEIAPRDAASSQLRLYQRFLVTYEAHTTDGRRLVQLTSFRVARAAP